MTRPPDEAIYVARHTESGGETRTLEVFTSKVEADGWLMNALMRCYVGHIEAVEPGGQLSLLVTLGAAPGNGESAYPEGVAPPPSVGSFSIQNENGDRHVWDFQILPYFATPYEEE